MTTAYLRSRVSQIAFKAESTPGTDSIAGTPAAGDYVTCEATIRLTQETFPNTVQTGAYDDLAPIPGARRAEINVRRHLTGSGAAGTAPEWGKLLRAAACIETVTAAAVGAPTAATAGTATTATAQTPFGTTAQQYRGMPILLAGNPAAGARDVVVDYTTGRVVTLGNTYSPVLSASTTLQVPINVLYSPTSDETLETSLTCYAWVDDIRHIVTGLKAMSCAITLTDGGPAEIAMTLTGQVASEYQAVARPAGYTPVTRNPPLWRNGMSRLNRAVAAARSVVFDFGLRGAYLENPEAAQGYDPAIITGRAGRITMDPFAHSTNSPLRSGALLANTSMPFAAMWGDTAGNRFALMTPSAVMVDMSMGDRSGMATDQIVLVPDTPNAGIFLACY